jgi:hypothetical protein
VCCQRQPLRQVGPGLEDVAKRLCPDAEGQGLGDELVVGGVSLLRGGCSVMAVLLPPDTAEAEGSGQQGCAESGYDGCPDGHGR